MSTRWASSSDAIVQHSYASAPEYAEMRGVCGSMVAAKAEIVGGCFARQALYFLQALSLQPGGIKTVAVAILDFFPTLIEEPDYRALFAEKLRGMNDAQKQNFAVSLRLDEYLLKLCVDPATGFEFWASFSGKSRGQHGSMRVDLIEALDRYKKQISKEAASGFVLTTVGEAVFETLDFARITEGFCVIEGEPRWGKSEAAKNWCNRHLGEARYVSLHAINSRGIFFRTLAQALGLPSAHSLSPVKMQSRVEDFLRKAKMLLVVDEAHYMWGQQERMRTHPELVNWCMTMQNEGVAMAFVTTAMFSKRRQAYERQTDWNSGQLSGRIGRYQQLISPPTPSDYLAVTRKLLPEGCEDSISLIAAYAEGSGRFMQGVVTAVTEARYIAKKDNRATVTFRDVQKAISTYRLASDAAQKRAFSDKPTKRRDAGEPLLPPATLADAAERALKPSGALAENSRATTLSALPV